MAHVGITGTRKKATVAQHNALGNVLRYLRVINEPDDMCLHHGDCLGVDSLAHDLARAELYTIHIHPSIGTIHRGYNLGDTVAPTYEYLERNRHIVQSSHIMVAVPFEQAEIRRSGTWSTIRYAKSTECPLVIILPNGNLSTYKGRLNDEQSNLPYSGR